MVCHLDHTPELFKRLRVGGAFHYSALGVFSTMVKNRAKRGCKVNNFNTE